MAEKHDIDWLFNIEPEKPNKMNANEYYNRSNKLFSIIDMLYSKAWKSKMLRDSDFPNESVCDKCTGQGVCIINEEEKDCYQDRENGDCFYRFFDSEEFGLEVENNIGDVHELLSITGLTPQSNNN